MNMDDMGMILPDIPRVYTALAEWLACMLCIFETKRRFSNGRQILISLVMLFFQVVFLEITGDLEGIFWMLCMAAAVAVMYFFLFVSCESNAKDVGYLCVRAFVVAEFAASLEWQIDCFFYFIFGLRNIVFRVICLLLIYGLVYILTWIIFKKYSKTGEQLQVTNKELISYIIIGLAVFLTSNLGFVPVKTPFSGRYTSDIFNVRTLIDLGGVAILYAYHVQRMELKVRHELELVQGILHNQYVQYKQSREAMELISYKYHDLKHHIIALRAEENTQKRNEYLDKMEQETKNYEAQNKTGNHVLDTLLTTKNLYCMKHEILLTSVVDGTLFEFMDVMDICSIFGNALDNAIECELQIKEKDKRLIHVSAFSKNNFLIIRVENYCENGLNFETGFPATTKKNPQFHGYGLKSIRYTVKKYAGEVDVSVQDNWFNLKILIPLEI